jgi:3-oxoadipate enol-lactonase
MSAAHLEHVAGTPRIALERSGDPGRPCVIFLHGIGGNRTNWREQLAALGAEFCCVAWDARGYGDSDDPVGEWEFADFSRDLLRVLDHLGQERAHVVGLSLGGRIAQDFVGRSPERVRSLILCDTFSGPQVGFGPQQREAFLRARKQPLLDGKRPSDIAPAIADSLLGSAATAQQRERLIESLSALRPGPYMQTLDVVTRHDASADLGAIRVPVLLVFGEDDRLTPPELGKRMQAQIPGSRLERIPGAGHLVNIEQPEAFNRLALEFLRAASAR